MQTKLRDLVHIRAGYQTRKGVEPAPDGSHFILQIRDFDSARTSLDLSSVARIHAETVNEEQLLRPGDLVFLSKGTRNFSFAPTEFPGPTLAASYFFVLRPVANVEPTYLSWFLNLESTRRLVAKFATSGAHMPVIRREVLEDLEVPLPDLETQRKIVELADLMRHQQDLLADFAASQKTLITEVCQRLANNTLKDTNHHE